MATWSQRRSKPPCILLGMCCGKRPINLESRDEELNYWLQGRGRNITARQTSGACETPGCVCSDRRPGETAFGAAASVGRQAGLGRDEVGESARREGGEDDTVTGANWVPALGWPARGETSLVWQCVFASVLFTREAVISRSASAFINAATDSSTSTLCSANRLLKNCCTERVGDEPVSARRILHSWLTKS